MYYYFSQWHDDGTWKQVHDKLVTWCRIEQERHPSPSAGSLDFQSVPTAVMVHHQVVYDGGKKTKGRKRFTLVETLGLLIMVNVVAANVSERKGAKKLLHKLDAERERVQHLARIWVDGGFSDKDFLCWAIDIAITTRVRTL